MKSKILFLCFLQSILGELDTTWWKYTTLYEVYLPSFKDGNGDGYGDIKGLTMSLDHFVESNIETVYVTPFYQSPMLDGGYDISNFTDVNPIFGTMEDFEELVAETKKKGLKLIIDVIINHSSNQHPWFIDSIDKKGKFTNYYVWENAKGFDENGNPIPPNNWKSLFNDGSAWEWNSKRRQFYYRNFAKAQPDLNLRNKDVRDEVINIFKFWLDKGVSGFRLDATKYLIEDSALRDEPPVIEGKIPKTYQDLKHIYTSDLWESYELLHEIREFVDEYCQKFTDYERIILPEAYGMGHYITWYYGKPDYKISHFPLNFALVRIFNYEDANFYDKLINTYLKTVPKGATPSWNIENHDNLRRAQLFCEEYEQILLTWIMLLPGVAYILYGQEIGMTGTKLRKDQQVDKLPDDFSGLLRDPARLPMQWDDTLNAGFTTNSKTFLPVSPNYWRINVKTLKQQENSRYYFFKKLTDLRNTDTIKYGSFKSYVLTKWIWAFKRMLSGSETYVVVCNLGTETEMINLRAIISGIPDEMFVETAGINTGYKPGDKIKSLPSFTKMLMVRPMSVIVLSSRNNFKQKKNDNKQLGVLLNTLR